MRKRYFFILTATLLLMTGSISCKKYLQVQPQDQFMEDVVYSNAISIQNLVNGFYTNMAKPDLYGGNMTMTTVDLMAQYYDGTTFDTNLGWGLLPVYQYNDNFTMGKFSAIWSQSYRTILNLNSFIERLPNVPANVISEERKAILLGEAYGLRAFLHFDMLRLFGPIYANSPGVTSIPYVTTPTKEIQPLLPASTIMEHILEDLQTALSKLEKDPVRTSGVEPVTGNDPVNDFYKLRNRRMNYFAVKAMLARVSLYKGDQMAALNYASTLITECGRLFKWSPGQLSLPGVENPDRVFSSEVLFGLENSDLYNAQRSYFSSAITNEQIFAPFPDRLKEIFPFENDYRYRSSWILDQTSTKSYKTFFKFSEVTSKTSVARYLQPLIRISELYYIAAETEPDPVRARTYLNEVRTNRGLANVTDRDEISAEIMNEYRREFWGEGQTFFYFKRKNAKSIPDGSTENSMRNMTTANYVVPLPLIETDNR